MRHVAHLWNSSLLFPLEKWSRPSFEYISLYPKMLCVEFVKIDQGGSGEEGEKL